MEPFIVQGAIKLADGIYKILTDNKDSYPGRLEGNILALFQEFKAAIDSKDIKKLSNTISDSYSGNFLKSRTKREFINCFAFENLPSFIYPNFTINVYQIPENNDQVFRAILDFKTYYKLALVTLTSVESGRVYVEARPDGVYGMWRITSIKTIQD